ncbi:MAG: MerR family transcriptional regulator [Bacteroidales bacterium]|nr:MerR family transcriptional regulator [Bacteroidales bacterium]
MEENPTITNELPESIAEQGKIWYGIGETAEALGVPASTLRFWEKEFDMIKPRKNGKGDRFYSKNDIAILRTIQYLTKVKGYTLQGAKSALKTNFIHEAETAAIVGTLMQIKDKLLEIKKLL